MSTAARILRDRQDTHAITLDLSAPALPDGAAAILGTTVAITTYPTTPSSYYGIAPTQLSGDEVEGATATTIPDPNVNMFAWNAGVTVPPVGTLVACHSIGGRWVFRYD